MRSLSLEGKVLVFKSLAISKITFQALASPIPEYTLNTLINMQMEFLWRNKKVKIKHDTLRNSFEDGGLKSVHISFKLLVYSFRGCKDFLTMTSVAGK